MGQDRPRNESLRGSRVDYGRRGESYRESVHDRQQRPQERGSLIPVCILVSPGVYLLSVIAVGPNLLAAALAFILVLILVAVSHAQEHHEP